MLIALSEYFLQQTVKAVRASPFFGFVVDLSSDRRHREHMLVYVTYWDWKSMRPVLEYLCCARLLRKTADCIFDALKNICSVLGLDMK
jgi:hypothetical protein